MKPVIRKAKMADVNQIKRIVNNFAEAGKMLPLSINQIYDRLRNFWVIESGGKVIGCGALKIIWKDLGEIRSIAISSKYQKKGYGNLLIDKLFEEADAMDIKKIFVLTYIPGFFEKLGFDRNTTADVVMQLNYDGLIEFLPHGGLVRITNKGIKEVKQSLPGDRKAKM